MLHVGVYMIPPACSLSVSIWNRCGIGSKLPDLVCGSYVDVKSAQDVELVVGYRKPTRQDCARGIPRPVVAAKEGWCISGRIVGKTRAVAVVCPAASRPRNR